MKYACVFCHDFVACSAFLFLCASTHSQAASNVKIYGVLDVGMSSFSRSSISNSRLTKINTDTNSSSLWGLTGTEDLGGGLAAQFALEAGLDPKSGGGTGTASSGANTPIPNVFWHRSSWVGLKSDSFGSIQVGRNYTTTILTQLINGSPMPNTSINSSDANVVVAQGMGNDFRNSNMIRYDSPMIAGFNIGLQYAFGEQTYDSSAGKGVGAVISYTFAPFKMALSYQKNNGVNDSAGNHANDDVNYWILTGSYDVGKYRASFLFDKVNNKNKIPYGWVDSKAWLIGGNYAFTPLLRVGVAYSQINAGDSAVASTSYDKKSKFSVVTAHYTLSKRTYLYSTFGHATNGIAPIQPLWGGNQGGQQTVKGASINGFVVGVVHRF